MVFPSLREDLFYDLAVNIRQTKITAEVARGRFKVVDAELVQDGCVEVVDVDPA